MVGGEGPGIVGKSRDADIKSRSGEPMFEVKWRGQNLEKFGEKRWRRICDSYSESDLNDISISLHELWRCTATCQISLFSSASISTLEH